jgi:hypothetical protein
MAVMAYVLPGRTSRWKWSKATRVSPRVLASSPEPILASHSRRKSYEGASKAPS